MHKPARHAANTFQSLRVGGADRGDLEQTFIPDNALAGDIQLLRLTFPPGRDFPQKAQHTPIMRAGLQTLPLFFRVRLKSRGVLQHGELSLRPILSSGCGKFIPQSFIHFTQVGDIRSRVIPLRRRQRADGSITESMRLIDASPCQDLHQGVVTDLIPVSSHHCGDLRVVNRRRQIAEQMQENLQILTDGVEDLDAIFYLKECGKRCQIHPLGTDINQGHIRRTGELHKT